MTGFSHLIIQSPSLLSVKWEHSILSLLYRERERQRERQREREKERERRQADAEVQGEVWGELVYLL